MIYSLNGKLLLVKDNFIVVQCAGVGYKCMCSLCTKSHFEKSINETVSVFTYLNAHQDSIELFGFYSERELEHFKLLISVSGVGPKVALGILSCFKTDELARIISSGDVKSLTQAPGIGGKTAKRVILELKDKFSSFPLDSGDVAFDETAVLPNALGKKKEALNALMFLGYSKAEVMPYLSTLSESISVEEMINLSLKHMGKGG